MTPEELDKIVNHTGRVVVRVALPDAKTYRKYAEIIKALSGAMGGSTAVSMEKAKGGKNAHS